MGLKALLRPVTPKPVRDRIRWTLHRILKVKYRHFGRPATALESTKASARRHREGFFDKFCRGRGLDVGHGGDPITPTAEGFDYEDGDAQYLPGVERGAYDYVYSSHTIEHMVDPAEALRNWWSAVKPGGFLILYLPHRDLYEKKKTLPSNWNDDHKHFFLVDRDEAPHTLGIIPLIERTLTGHELIYVKECSEGHSFTGPGVPPTASTPSKWCCEREVPSTALRIENPRKRRLARLADLALSAVARPWGALTGLNRRSSARVTGPRTILFVRLDHIGDFLMTLPAMALVRERYPLARTIALTGSWSEGLARLSPAIDEVITWDAPWWRGVRGTSQSKMSAWREARQIIRALHARDIDLAIDFRGDLRQIILFLWMTRSRTRVSFARSGGASLLTNIAPYDPEEHVTDQAFTVMRAAGIEGEAPPGPHLRADAANAAWADQTLIAHGVGVDETFALLHPGARVSLRAWPAERCAEVATHLWQAHGMRGVIVGDAADAARAGVICEMTESPVINLAAKTSLPQLAALARRARLFIGNDSGLMHLACACGLPTVAIFGPNHPRRCGPRGVPARVARREFDCSPCLQIRCIHTAGPTGQCLLDLPAAEVIGAVDDLLAEVDRRIAAPALP